ncbi:hypothetical protein B0H13DRAFT_2237305 [Mycena leptocephala]|nr:hypothetical protein B0H13DRAFT_2237305 [Mycena leptocephala]
MNASESANAATVVPTLALPRQSSLTASSSYRTIYTSPPPVKMPYCASEALSDLPGVSYALDQFLSSRMHESEDYMNASDMNASDTKKERLYFATGYGLIACIKGLISYADEDLLDAIGHCKQGVLIASQHRKKAPHLPSRLAGYVVSSLNTTGVGFVRTMTDIERHAELVYAESLFEKALLGIVYSGDWLAFIKEALNMRTIISIYRTLYKYVQAVDADEKKQPIESPALDAHFRSGVYLGAALSTLILSLLPARYAADRAEALEILGRAGGWGPPSTSPSYVPDAEPTIATADEGVRRAICDMALLIFHLVLSSFTFDRVDTRMAGRVVDWNLRRYPEGVFFLFGAGRLALMRSQPERAIEYYTKAMTAQTQYRNLHHISFWEMAIAHLALADVDRSLECWRTLEGRRRKSIYSYGMAVCLLESTAGDEADRKKRVEEARKLMERVPTLRQKIAGKSIPLEKFVARKARKFLAQDNRLALSALEISYVFLGIAHAPRKVVEQSMLPAVRGLLASLGHGSAAEEKEDGAGKDKELKEREKAQGYWDDYCLARFLEGVCLRYVAFPDPDAVLDPTDVPSLPRDEAAAGAKAAFEAVFEHGPKIELDHHMVYHAHYELGRLTACLGDEAEAKRHFDLVLSGKDLEVGPSGRKIGKYSMENALIMRTHAAVEALHQKRL